MGQDRKREGKRGEVWRLGLGLGLPPLKSQGDTAREARQRPVGKK